MGPAYLLRALVLIVVFPGRLFPCSCAPSASAAACEKLSSAEVVFTGTVLAAEPDPQYPRLSQTRIYRFGVDTAYKGLPRSARQVVVNPDNLTSCRTQFVVGKKYLVFGERQAGTAEIVSGGCSGSRFAASAKEDIEFLEAYRLKRAGNSVYGRVLQWVGSLSRPLREEDAPVAGANVVLRSGSRVLTQRTTRAGDFRFENIPAGRYSLSAWLAPYISKPEPLTIEVPAVGCVERFPVLDARAGLSGLVVNEFGKPAPGMRVELLRRNQAGMWYGTSQFLEETDHSGEFLFEGLPEGEYLLGYSIWWDKPSEYSAYPPAYYPGVADRARASVLRLTPGQAIRGLRLPLGKPHTPRRIHVSVVWPDGSAPARNLLQLYDGDDLLENAGVSVPDRPVVPHKGVIDFVGYAERRYDLHVRYWIDDPGGPVPHDRQRIARSAVVRLTEGKEPASVRLVLTETMLADAER